MKDMARLFPEVAVPAFARGEVLIAYAYLRASVPFPRPYLEDSLTFVGSDGEETKARAFGLRIRGGRGGDVRALSEQIDLLFATTGETERLDEYALDLCKQSTPHQIVVARVPKQDTLAKTVAVLQERTERPKPARWRPFSWMDELLVPVMNWKVEHRFTELEGPQRRFLEGPLKGLYTSHASQTIHFDLDHTGARMESKAVKLGKGSPRDFYFDRPFLLVMRKRGAAHPFFVMWVENAELLARP